MFREGDDAVPRLRRAHATARCCGYVDRCPHTGLPLAPLPDRYLTRESDLILCGSHGALFRIGNGICVAGPCAGRALWPWPVRVEGEEVVAV